MPARSATWPTTSLMSPELCWQLTRTLPSGGTTSWTASGSTFLTVSRLVYLYANHITDSAIETHLGYDGYWQQPMRNTLPDMRFVQTAFPSLGGEIGVGVEGSNASVQGDDKWHTNSANDLATPPLDPYGALTRYFEVFTRGTQGCEWTASPWQPWVKLSQYNGTVGGNNGTDTRVHVSIDWENAPKAPNATQVYINITTPCRGLERYAGPGQRVIIPVVNRAVPSNFTKGFVESDGHVSIEGPHYQNIVQPSSSSSSNSSSNSSKLEYHVFENYGRTLGGVGLYPADSEKVKLGEGPALEYNMYLFTNSSKANVTLYISPTANYLGDGNPLEYGISLFPSGSDGPQPKTVQPVGKTQGQNMPDGWGYAVGDAVWGLTGNYTTTSFNVTQEGAYTLRIWALLPNIIVQKVVVDLGGVRKSYLGPPESFLLGRDEQGKYNQTTFTSSPGVVGGHGNQNATRLEQKNDKGDKSAGAKMWANGFTTGVLAMVMGVLMTMF
ncbi:immunoglobulin i-set domain-containing protein [Colletotrichum truncatum]|uniref:Immunoglobulin i-set domain-containing protein n=1 Tax=Colletotrichum truncatum TaxID=5467 RepID=A0ACC3YXW3_COLTU